jgi:hypothetical protein
MTPHAPPLGRGLHHNIPATVYHADPAPCPSLSSTIARTILAKSLAHAHSEHPRLGGTRKHIPTAAMDRGSLVHALLSNSTEHSFAVEEFATFRSKAAQEWAASVRAAGKIPALADDIESAKRIAQAVRAKAALGLTIDPLAERHHEVTAIWSSEGAYYRARYDLLEREEGHPWTIWDWKVTDDVSVAAVKRKFRRYGYHYQAAHYLAGANALCPQFAGRHSLIFVFVEDDEPYSVRRYCLRADTLSCASIDMHRVHGQWAQAMSSGHWPDASRVDTMHIDVPIYDDDDDGTEIAT